jgi:2-(1,2-epoxy-1,2-dihydrophenyl)acetyl-CoA isomerase
VSAVDYALAERTASITLVAGDQGNPFTLPMAAELVAAVQRARRDDAHVLVLRARGRAFSVGGDVRAFAAAPERGQFVEDLAELFHRAVSDLHRADAVVVAAVQGVAAGAGLSVASAADVVLAGESARFTMAYTRIGLSPDGGASLLVSSLGLHRTLALGLLNTVLSAHEAQAAGLVHAVHPDAELEDATQRVVDQLLAGSRQAQVATKRLLRSAAQPLAEGQLRQEALSISRSAASPDGREGVDAFLDKRAPAFPSSQQP